MGTPIVRAKEGCLRAIGKSLLVDEPNSQRWSMKIVTKLLLFLALASPVLQAGATTYAVHFQATVTSITPGSGLPAPGSHIAGDIWFSDLPQDSRSQAVPGEGPGYANYQFDSGAFHYTVQSSAGVASSSLFVLEVFDQGSVLNPTDFPTDSVVFGMKVQNVYNGLFLTGPNGTFSGNGIPGPSTLNAVWSSARFVMWDYNNFTRLSADVTGLTAAAVPEPAAWLLLLLGIGACAYQRQARCRALQPDPGSS